MTNDDRLCEGEVPSAESDADLWHDWMARAVRYAGELNEARTDLAAARAEVADLRDRLLEAESDAEGNAYCRPPRPGEHMKPPMVMRSHRFPKALYEKAKTKADERQENISDVLREALERYVRRR